jgi:3-hydroxy-9,10-secoandrosta-1,3,5(10)-triene-9,17-dione monooxygenase reductase component
MRPSPEPTDPVVSGTELRHAMGHFATGVTVVTALDADGERVGTTANAIASLSLDPPLILVCFEQASQTLAAIRHSGAFGVNVLAAHHEHLSTAFARRGSDEVWTTIEHGAGRSGAPRLHDAIAHLDCAVEQRIPGGDHEIIVGRVLDVATDEQDGQPLLFYRGTYASLAA